MNVTREMTVSKVELHSQGSGGTSVTVVADSGDCNEALTFDLSIPKDAATHPQVGSKIMVEIRWG